MIRYTLILAAILATAALDEYPVAASVDLSTRPRPSGYTEFCAANRPLCLISDRREPYPISQAEIETAAAINTEVNRSIRYAPRPALDPWDIDPPVGDCDDFVATKLSRLVRAGIPRQNIRLAMVMTETDEVHLVILLRTGAGDLVLDNRRGDIVPATRTPYRFISVELMWGDMYSSWEPVEGMPR